MTVEEILASGTYTDRRGRAWEVFGQEGDLGIGWGYWEQPFGIQAVIGTHHLRTIIERDMHRDECPRLAECEGHPAWRVVQDYNGDGAWTCWEVIEPGEAFGTSFELPHGHALRIAQGMAVSNE